MRHTHTLSTMEVSKAAYEEIAAKLTAAGYAHVFIEDTLIDMTGVGITLEAEEATKAQSDTPAPSVKNRYVVALMYKRGAAFGIWQIIIEADNPLEAAGNATERFMCTPDYTDCSIARFTSIQVG